MAQGAIGLAMVPLITAVVGPSEYGWYAVAMATVAVAAAIAEGGAGMVLASELPRTTEDKHGEIVVSALGYALLLGAALGFLGYAVYLLLVRSTAPGPLGGGEALIAACLVVVRAGMAAFGQALVVAGKAGLAAGANVSGAAAGAVATLFLLYGHGAGVDGLLAGQLVAGMVWLSVGLLGSGLAARGRPRLELMRKIARNTPATAAAAVTDQGRNWVESVVLLKWWGPAVVGLYSHARIYQAYAVQGMNVMAYALWPHALEACAQEDAEAIERVRRYWRRAYALLAALGSGAALFGRDVVDILTHGRFTEASIWIAPLIAYVIVQHVGRVSLAWVYARGCGKSAAWIRTATSAAGIVGVAFLARTWGVAGAIAVAFAEMLLYRLVLRRYAKRLDAPPDVDGYAIAMAALVLGVSLMV